MRCLAALLTLLALAFSLRGDDQAVKSGAPLPGSDAPASPAKHWAFQPVRKPAVNAPPGVNPVDALLGSAQLAPTDPRILVRRMTYDLTR